MKKILLTIFIVLTIIIGYGFFIEPNSYKIIEEDIKINNLPDAYKGLKIVQISDLLLKTSKDVENIKYIFENINNLNPDLIFFTGDLINNKNKLTDDDIKNITTYFNNLECSLYKYSIYGDNDLENITTYQEIMNNSNFKILDNESTYLFYKDNKPIKLTGLTNIDNINKSLEITDNLDTAFNLVITHYPDYMDYLKNYQVDVILAGHNLKGQIRIPFYGGTIKKEWGKKYLDSKYTINDTNLYISGGIGTENIKFRLFNKPEINLYRLTK